MVLVDQPLRPKSLSESRAQFRFTNVFDYLCTGKWGMAFMRVFGDIYACHHWYPNAESTRFSFPFRSDHSANLTFDGMGIVIALIFDN